LQETVNANHCVTITGIFIEWLRDPPRIADWVRRFLQAIGPHDGPPGNVRFEFVQIANALFGAVDNGMSLRAVEMTYCKLNARTCGRSLKRHHLTEALRMIPEMQSAEFAAFSRSQRDEVSWGITFDCYSQPGGGKVYMWVSGQAIGAMGGRFCSLLAVQKVKALSATAEEKVRMIVDALVPYHSQHVSVPAIPFVACFSTGSYRDSWVCPCCT
jgi:hypothetical protein